MALFVLIDDYVILSGQRRELEHYASDQITVLLVRPDRKDERRRFGTWAGCGNGSIRSATPSKDQLGLERHGGRIPRAFHTDRSAAAGFGRLHLAQLDHHHHQLAVADRL